MKDLKSSDRYPSVPWIDKDGNLKWYPGEIPNQDTLEYFENDHERVDQAVTQSLP